MAGSTLENRQGAGGMAQVGKDTAIGGGGQPGVRFFLLGSDTSCTYVWSRVLGAVGKNYEDSGE